MARNFTKQGEFGEVDKISQLMELMGVEGQLPGQKLGKKRKLSTKLLGLIDELEKSEAIDKKLLRYLTVKVKKFDLDTNYFAKNCEKINHSCKRSWFRLCKIPKERYRFCL